MGNIVSKKIGMKRSIEILKNHPHACVIAQTLGYIETIKIAAILEWRPMQGKLLNLFKEACAFDQKKKATGFAMSHFFKVAKDCGVPQAILSQFSQTRTAYRQDLKARKPMSMALYELIRLLNQQTKLFINILLEKALPNIHNRDNVAFGETLMKEITVI